MALKTAIVAIREVEGHGLNLFAERLGDLIYLAEAHWKRRTIEGDSPVRKR